MTTPNDPTMNGYRIGKVSKLTGISPDTLRVWERRYEAVIPMRSPTGGRLYTSDDITRLKLIKQLVDAGDTIGAIAGLNRDELQSRLAESRESSTGIAREAPFRIVIIGEALAVKTQQAQAQLNAIELVASYATIAAFEAERRDIEADVFVIEQPTLQTETSIRISDWVTRLKAAHAVVIYRFASQDTLNRLPSARTTTMRAPVEPATLQQHCIALGAHVNKEDSGAPALTNIPEPAPPRRYSDETLAKLAMLSPAIKCECPRHLAELLTSLTAFEQYSNECESRSTRDAELHAYLYTATSHARHIIENALGMVIEAEHIDV